MYVTDTVVYVLAFLVAAFFTAFTFFPMGDEFEEDLASEGFRIGMLPTILRIVFFPLVAAISWAVLAIYSLTLDNCVTSFNACYTSPTLSVTTASIISNPFGVGLAILFFTLTAVLIVMFVAIAFTMYGEIMVAVGRRAQ